MSRPVKAEMETEDSVMSPMPANWDPVVKLERLPAEIIQQHLKNDIDAKCCSETSLLDHTYHRLRESGETTHVLPTSTPVPSQKLLDCHNDATPSGKSLNKTKFVKKADGSEISLNNVNPAHQSSMKANQSASQCGNPVKKANVRPSSNESSSEPLSSSSQSHFDNILSEKQYRTLCAAVVTRDVHCIIKKLLSFSGLPSLILANIFLESEEAYRNISPCDMIKLEEDWPQKLLREVEEKLHYPDDIALYMKQIPKFLLNLCLGAMITAEKNAEKDPKLLSINTKKDMVFRLGVISHLLYGSISSKRGPHQDENLAAASNSQQEEYQTSGGQLLNIDAFRAKVGRKPDDIVSPTRKHTAKRVKVQRAGGIHTLAQEVASTKNQIHSNREKLNLDCGVVNSENEKDTKRTSEDHESPLKKVKIERSEAPINVIKTSASTVSQKDQNKLKPLLQITNDIGSGGPTLAHVIVTVKQISSSNSTDVPPMPILKLTHQKAVQITGSKSLSSSTQESSDQCAPAGEPSLQESSDQCAPAGEPSLQESSDQCAPAGEPCLQDSSDQCAPAGEPSLQESSDQCAPAGEPSLQFVLTDKKVLPSSSIHGESTSVKSIKKVTCTRFKRLASKTSQSTSGKKQANAVKRYCLSKSINVEQPWRSIITVLPKDMAQNDTGQMTSVTEGPRVQKKMAIKPARNTNTPLSLVDCTYMESPLNLPVDQFEDIYLLESQGTNSLCVDDVQTVCMERHVVKDKNMVKTDLQQDAMGIISGHGKQSSTSSCYEDESTQETAPIDPVKNDCDKKSVPQHISLFPDTVAALIGKKQKEHTQVTISKQNHVLYIPVNNTHMEPAKSSDLVEDNFLDGITELSDQENNCWADNSASKDGTFNFTSTPSQPNDNDKEGNPIEREDNNIIECPFCTYVTKVGVRKARVLAWHVHNIHCEKGTKRVNEETLLIYNAKKMWFDNPLCPAADSQVFVCPFCLRLTTSRMKHYRHILMHDNQRRHITCFPCAKSFASYRKLFKHYSSKHGLNRLRFPPDFSPTIPQVPSRAKYKKPANFVENNRQPAKAVFTGRYRVRYMSMDKKNPGILPKLDTLVDSVTLPVESKPLTLPVESKPLTLPVESKPDRKYWCEKCHRPFKKENSWMLHRSKCEKPMNLVTCECKKCGQHFHYESVLERHYAKVNCTNDPHFVPSSKIVHRSKERSVTVCDVCGKTLRKAYTLKYHKYVKHGIVEPNFSGVSRVQCDKCGLELDKQRLNFHLDMMNCTNDPDFKPSEESIKKYRIHKCTKCGRRFAKRSSLLLHNAKNNCTNDPNFQPRNVAVNVRKVECKKCHKMLASQGSLLRHYAVVNCTGDTSFKPDPQHANRPVQCKKCMKWLYSNNTLKEHNGLVNCTNDPNFKRTMQPYKRRPRRQSEAAENPKKHVSPSRVDNLVLHDDGVKHGFALKGSEDHEATEHIQLLSENSSATTALLETIHDVQSAVCEGVSVVHQEFSTSAEERNPLHDMSASAWLEELSSEQASVGIAAHEPHVIRWPRRDALEERNVFTSTCENSPTTKQINKSQMLFIKKTSLIESKLPVMSGSILETRMSSMQEMSKVGALGFQEYQGSKSHLKSNKSSIKALKSDTGSADRGVIHQSPRMKTSTPSFYNLHESTVTQKELDIEEIVKEVTMDDDDEVIEMASNAHQGLTNETFKNMLSSALQEKGMDMDSASGEVVIYFNE